MRKNTRKRKKSRHLFIQKRDVKVFELLASGPHDLLSIARSCFDLRLEPPKSAHEQKKEYAIVANRLRKLADANFLIVDRYTVLGTNLTKNLYRLGKMARDFLVSECGYRLWEIRMNPVSHAGLPHELIVRDCWKQTLIFLKKYRGRLIEDFDIADEFYLRKHCINKLTRGRSLPDIKIEMKLNVRGSEKRHEYIGNLEVDLGKESLRYIGKKMRGYEFGSGDILFITDTEKRKKSLMRYFSKSPANLYYPGRILFTTITDFSKFPLISSKGTPWINAAGKPENLIQ